MLVQWLGDQSFVIGHVLRFSVLSCKMVGQEYHYLVYVKPRVLKMRENYPNVRLDINGNPRIH